MNVSTMSARKKVGWVLLLSRLFTSRCQNIFILQVFAGSASMKVSVFNEFSWMLNQYSAIRLILALG